MDIIKKCERRLRTENEHLRLDGLLYGMLQDAPHPAGKRYVADSLQAAYTQGEEAVVDLAKIWLENLFLPLFALSSSSASHQPEPNLTNQVAKREKHRCAITNSIDINYVHYLAVTGWSEEDKTSTSRASQKLVETAHIMPPMLHYDYANERSWEEKLTERKAHSILTWDLLEFWSNVNLCDLSEENAQSPSNGIFMTATEHARFKKYMLYLDEVVEAGSKNKYKAHLIWDKQKLSNGATTADVEFNDARGVATPNPHFLKIHASISKVLRRSQVIQYYHNFLEAPKESPLPLDTKDGASLLACKLSIVAMGLPHPQASTNLYI